MMNFITYLDPLIKYSHDNFSGKKLSSIKIYCHGLISKIQQLDYALEQIKSIHNNPSFHFTFSRSTLDYHKKIEFYNDCFWTFLYSTLEITCQIINQCLDLGINEKDVTFNSITNHLNQPVNIQISQIY